MKHTKSSMKELITSSRVRNRLLIAKTVQAELAIAARRVMRLSEPGRPERLLTLNAIADETGLSAGLISRAIVKASLDRRRKARRKSGD